MGDIIAIDAEFPGGNIIIDDVGEQEVRIHQDLRDTEGDWFYWCFRIRGAAGRSMSFRFTGSQALGVRGPAYSLDEGERWQWLGDCGDEGYSFEFSFPDDAESVRFSFGMPYQLSRWERFATGLGGSEHFTRDVLCETRTGRPVPYARVGELDRRPGVRAVLTCRHHCCEMMASYTLEGLINWAVTAGEAEAAWLREHAELLILPFADLDGVEDGDQGKNRRPRDHNRDYEGESIYPTIAAWRELVPRWGGEVLVAGLDLHCPWISGNHNEVIYLVGSADDAIAGEQRRFSHILETVCSGPLPFVASDYLPFGTAWNTGANRAGGRSSTGWLSELPGVRLAAGMEIPYANAGGAEVNQRTARAFGADLGRALAEYLKHFV